MILKKTTPFYFLTVLFLIPIHIFSQHRQWILGTSEQSSLGVFNTTSANKLKFFQVDFNSGSPVFAQRTLGNSVNNIVSIGTAEALNCGVDSVGNVAFYVFANPTQPFNSGAWTSDTIYFIAYNNGTTKDEVFAKIPTPANEVGSTKNIEVVKRDGAPNQYYVIYKTAANNIRPNDEIRYVVVDMNAKTISVPVTLMATNLNEGMAVSAKNCALNNRWFFFTRYSSGNLQVYRSSITSANISVPVLQTTINIAGNATGGQNDIEISPLSDKIAFANLTANSVNNDVTVFDLNLSTGTISNQRYIDNPNNYIVALQFSPNGKQLYISRAGTMSITSDIYNVTVSASNYTIAAADKIIGNLPQTMCIELAYDGKVYFQGSPYNTFLYCVNNPDAVAASNVITQTIANSFGVGNATGFAIPDQIDGDFNILNTAPSVVSATNVSCNGGLNGSITMTISGGTGVYTYSWSPSGGTSLSATGLSAGSYTLTVIDGNGCSKSQSASISQPASIAFATGSVPSTCNLSNGTASVTATGGTGAFTYSWSPGGSTTSSANGISAGSYTVAVADANGCTGTASVNVTNTGSSPSLSLSASSNPLCKGQATGSVTISAGGGTMPYTFSWSNGQTGTTATALSAGIYTVSVTDANGCQRSQTVVITEPAAIVVSASGINTACTSFTGSASASAAGGTGSFSYAWSNGITTPSITALSAGNYSVVVTDANNCTSTAMVTIGISGGPTADAGVNVSIQKGASTGLSGSGGITYTWAPPNGLSCTNCQNPTASPSATTTYTVMVTDNNGCTAIDSVTVTVTTLCQVTDTVPNVFSPNGDGYNDVFKISNGGLSSFTCAVYDRWGILVYEWHGNNGGWDGRSTSGVLSSEGTYYYVLKATCTDGETIERTGFLTLLR